MSTDTPLREQVAEEIRALLGRRKMSGSELARRLDVTQRYMSRRLTGETAFDMDDLERIANALNVEVGDLLPRSREGRLITAGGAAREGQPELKQQQIQVANRSPIIGYPNRTHTSLSTRRPSRLMPAHA